MYYMTSSGPRLVMTEMVIQGVNKRSGILQRQEDCHEFDASLGYRDPV